MQTLYRFIMTSALLILISSLAACYPHTGKPFSQAAPDWNELALEACQRGDHNAFQALSARANLDATEKECP